MLTSNLSRAELEKLNYERFHYPCPMVQKRVHAVYLKAHLGGSNASIGRICDLHANSVGTWLGAYEQGGIQALFKNNYGTNHSELQTYGGSILESFAQEAPITSNQAVARIEALTHITRSPTAVRNWMHKNGLKFRKMGHLPAKVNVAQQGKWLAEQLHPVIEKAKNQQCHLFFMDAAHFVLNPFLCSVWCLVRLFIKAPAGRQRLNVVGAVHAITKQIITLCNDSYVNAEVIAQFLRKLRAEFGDLPLVIVLDNARYQHCQFIQQLADELAIQLLFLPPYSPNRRATPLNIIERLWKMTKKHCLYAKYYENFQLFSTTITCCLNNFSQEELDKTLTLKFQTFENTQFYPV